MKYLGWGFLLFLASPAVAQESSQCRFARREYVEAFRQATEADNYASILLEQVKRAFLRSADPNNDPIIAEMLIEVEAAVDRFGELVDRAKAAKVYEELVCGKTI